MTQWTLCELMQVALGLGQKFEFSGLSLLKWVVAPDKTLPLGLCGCPQRDKTACASGAEREGGRSLGREALLGPGETQLWKKAQDRGHPWEAKGQKRERTAPRGRVRAGGMGLGQKAGPRRGPRAPCRGNSTADPQAPCKSLEGWEPG